MAEPVQAIEERTVTWPERWAARAAAKMRAEGIEEERLTTSQMLLSSLESSARARFDESVARSFRQTLQVTLRAEGAWDREVLGAICECVLLSESGKQLFADPQSLRLGGA